MSRAVYCGECGFATQVSTNNRVPTRMEHTDSCSRRHIKTSIAYAMAFGIPVPVEVDDVDVNARRADSGWLYVDQPNCGCGVDVSDIPIELTITSYTKDASTSTVICMQWHTLCYLNSFVEV